jgi:hypothetical protein
MLFFEMPSFEAEHHRVRWTSSGFDLLMQFKDLLKQG